MNYLLLWPLLSIIFSGPVETKTLSCKKPNGKLWSKILTRDCGQAVCQKVGRKAEWKKCPRAATEEKMEIMVKRLEKKIENSGSNPTTQASSKESTFLIVSRKNDEILFDVWDETIHCKLGSPPDIYTDQNIECSLKDSSDTADFTADSEQSSLFISSSSDGSPEWASLHTANSEFIHGMFYRTISTCAPNCVLIRKHPEDFCLCFVSVACTSNPTAPDLDGTPTPTPPPTPVGLDNKLYVEEAIPLPSAHTLPDAQDQCRTLCNNDADCKFWTLSFFDGSRDHDHEDLHPHVQDRTHNRVSECGLRYYEADVVIKTNPTQFVALRGDDQIIYEGSTFTWRIVRAKSDKVCCDRCKFTTGCTTWTFDQTKNGLCSLNSYTPTRVIDIGMFLPKPMLVSGCLIRAGTSCPAELDNNTA